jgi:gamma-glutamyltranspeptidase / glutathione hydrolase
MMITFPIRRPALFKVLVCVVSVLAVIAPALAVSGSSNAVRGDRVSGDGVQGRSALVAPHGAAATAHPLASRVAVDVLKAGGSAVDAAIAANAMLGLVEPTGCGIGGDLYALVWDPKTKKLFGYNGSGRSPKGQSFATVAAVAAKSPSGLIPSFGAVSVSVPGAVDGWFALHQRFGRASMAANLAPAISYARAGAPIPETIAYYWARNRDRLEREFKEGRLEEIDNARRTYWPGGVTPAMGVLFRNPDLANTYAEIARGGRNAFYRGPIARRMDAYMRRIGGALRLEDLAAHQGNWVEPLCAPYRNVSVCELGENTQGLAALQMLRLLEPFDLRGMGFLSADSLHVQIEAKRLAFADRALAFHDISFSGLDQSKLLDETYLKQRRAMISMARAMDDPRPGAWLESHGDTTYLTVADKDGMMVSLIQSNYRGMGSGLVPDGAGFMLQNRGELFAVIPGHPNVYAPGKRPFQTIIPAFAFKEGQPWLAFGLMGGDMQPQGHVQIIVNLVDYDMDLQAAGDAARWRHGGSAEPTGEMAEGRGYVVLESGVAGATRQDLIRRGHTLRASDGGFGGYQAIMRDFKTGAWIAASEMRKDGAADGY